MRIRFNSKSPIGFALSILFNFVFVGVGLFVAGYGYVQYQNGGPVQQFYMMGGFGSVFVLVGLFSMYRSWKQRQKAEDAAQRREQYADEPWKVRPAWRTPQIAEDTSSNGGYILMAVLWNAFSWPMAGWLIYDEMQKANPEWAVLFVLIFPAAGLFLGWGALSRVLHKRKYGVATFDMETMPGRLGQRLQGVIQTGVQAHTAPEEGFHVRLSCYRRYVRYTRDSDGDRRKEVKKDLKWRDEKKVRGRPYGAKDRLEVPISFELPTDQPPSTPEKKETRIMWKLDVEAEVPGLDFDTDFEIPVFEPEGGIEEGAAAPAAEAEGAVEEEAESEEVFWSLGDEEGGEIQRTETDAAEDESDPYAEYEVGGTFTEPVSDGIEMRRSSSGGLELHFAAGRNKGMALILTVVGVGMLVGGGLVLVNASFFGGLVILLIGAAAAYGAWYQWTNASTITIENGQVRVESGPAGRGSTTSFSCADLADIKVEAAGQMGESTLYRLNLYRMDAEAKKKAAEGAEKMGEVVSFLQSSGLVGQGQQPEAVTEKIRQQVEKHGTKVTVAGGLTNKQEADWLAAKIRKAAAREAQFA